MKQIDNNLVGVIMAGGKGTRFWPLSTNEKPKQFIQLFDNRSLLQKTYDRVDGIISDERIIILTNEHFIKFVIKQLPKIPVRNIIGEPQQKDTAAAICLSTLVIKRRFGNPVIIVLPADHLIEPLDLFQQTMFSAIEWARRTSTIYTFGIKPTYPATSYGYLEIGEKITNDRGIDHFHIVSFKEKPKIETAKNYLKSGRYLWNSGMFVWTVETIFNELTLHLPKHIDYLDNTVKKNGSVKWNETSRNRYKSLESISIDYALLEKIKNIRCVASEFSWKDVGSWLSYSEFLKHDINRNFIKGCVHTLNSQNNLVFCDHPKEILAIVGVNDLVVVRVGLKTLIVHKDHLEDVKHIVKSIYSKQNQ